MIFYVFKVDVCLINDGSSFFCCPEALSSHYSFGEKFFPQVLFSIYLPSFMYFRATHGYEQLSFSIGRVRCNLTQTLIYLFVCVCVHACVCVCVCACVHVYIQLFVFNVSILFLCLILVVEGPTMIQFQDLIVVGKCFHCPELKQNTQ